VIKSYANPSRRNGIVKVRRKNQRKMESCDNGEKLPYTEIKELSKQRELLPKSNSTITHQLNTIELINNCVESQESESKLEICDKNSSRRILRQKAIQMHQSASRDLDQSQRSSSSSSSTHAAASSYDVIASQSAIASGRPAQPKRKRYKRGRRGRTNHIAISDPEADTS